jgi:hypothetical protein
MANFCVTVPHGKVAEFTFMTTLGILWDFDLKVTRFIYSGNAKRFKRRPEKGERALILECNILDPKDQPVSQTCLACKDYFETQKYFKTNQECIGKIMLVKNNSPISVENGQFKILIKMMCCCVHHSVDYFLFELNLISTLTNNKEYSIKVPLNVKQWRKSNQKKEECVLLLEWRYK